MLLVLYLPELLGLLDVLCLLKAEFYFRVPIGLTVSRRIPSLTAKNCCFLPFRVKNADLYLINFKGIFKVFLKSLFQPVFNFGIIKNFVILNFPQIERTLKNQMSIYFLTLSNLLIHFFACDVIRVILSKGFDWFIRPFYAKRSWI